MKHMLSAASPASSRARRRLEVGAAVVALILGARLAEARPQQTDETKEPSAAPDAPTANPNEAPPPETRHKEPPEPGGATGSVVAANGAAAKAAPAPAPGPLALELTPYVAVAGGLKVDNVIDKEREDRDDRVVTFAVARFGLMGRLGAHAAVQSELMASGGVGLHGASAYEGQAALQVRQQLVRVTYAPLALEVGRILDEASVDYTSAHVQDTLLQDTATRDPLLYSGLNLGNGGRVSVEVVPRLRLALTFNAGNPVSTTATLAVGGTFPPFERIYTQAYQAVNQGPNHFPDDTFHSMVLTPSVLYTGGDVEVKVAAQGFDINTNTTRAGDDHVRGYNVRGTMRVKLLGDTLSPFASAAYTRNDTLEPNALDRRSPDRYQAVNLGGGVDVHVARRHAGREEAADGVGAQLQQVQFQVGDGLVTTLRYANLGGSYWLTPNVALGARAALWVQQQKGGADIGERTFTVGLRAVVP